MSTTSAISSMRSLVKTAIGNIKDVSLENTGHGEFTPPPSMKSGTTPSTDIGDETGMPKKDDVSESLSMRNPTDAPLPSASAPLIDDPDFEIDPVKVKDKSNQSQLSGLLNKRKSVGENDDGLPVGGYADMGKRINKKKLGVVLLVSVVLALAIKSMLGGNPSGPATALSDGHLQSDSDERRNTSATAATEASREEWTRVDPPKQLADLNTPPLGDQARIPPELLSGVDRERQAQHRVASGEILAAVATPTATPAATARNQDTLETASTAGEVQKIPNEPLATTSIQATLDEIKASTTKTEGTIETIGSRIDVLEKDVALLKTKNEVAAKAKAKAKEKPKLALKAITRTPNCVSCSPYALVEIGTGVKQVGQGDTLLGFTVSLDDDRIILSKGKLQHSYHLKDGF